MKALITGASSGIGLECAKYLASKKIEVILVARDREKLETIQKTLPTKTTIIVMDLSNEQKVKELYRIIPFSDKTLSIFLNKSTVHSIYSSSVLFSKYISYLASKFLTLFEFLPLTFLPVLYGGEVKTKSHFVPSSIILWIVIKQSSL